MIIHPPSSWLRSKAKAGARWARQAKNRRVGSALVSQAQIDQMLAERQATARGLGKELAGKEVAVGSAMAKRPDEPQKMTSSVRTSSSIDPSGADSTLRHSSRNTAISPARSCDRDDTVVSMPNQMTGPAAVIAANPLADNSPRQLPKSSTSTR